jgi:hypothetical protein
MNINLGASRVIFENLSVVVFYFADVMIGVDAADMAAENTLQDT